MSKRFEKVIVGAVMAGAVALGGCGEDPEVQQDSGQGPTLVDARTISDTEVALTFSDPVEVIDPGAATTQFSLRRTAKNYGAAGTANCVTAGSPSAWSCYAASLTDFYSFASGGPVAAVTGVFQPAPDTVGLRLDQPISEIDDGGTGALRLTYRESDVGLVGENRQPVADIVPPNNQPGNVWDATGSPALVAARTISASQIELVFNEPVTTASPGAAAQDFQIWSNEISGFQLGYFCCSPSPPSATVYGFTSNSPWWSGTSTVSGLSFTPYNMKATLNLNGTIGSTADLGGFLRLQYFAGSSPIEDADGNPLPDISIGNEHRGNVVDSI